MTLNDARRGWLLLLLSCSLAAAAPPVRLVGKESKAAEPEPLAEKSADHPIDPLDWPSWRGPEQNGISRETGLIDHWDLSGSESSNVLWKNAEFGGISSPIVMRGKLYSIVRAEPGTIREGEKVVCCDAETGKKIWENRFNVYLSDVPAERVGWSSCVGDPRTGRVFAMGVGGYFQCLDGETGKTIWKRSLTEEFGFVTTYGGRTNVPVLHDDLVIISAVVVGWGDMARPTHRFLAMNKETGAVVWFNGTKPLPEDTTYSTPVVTVLKGQAALVFGSGDGGVYAFQPRTGKPIWNFQLSRRGINVSPVVQDDVVYIAHAEENIDNRSMGAIVAIDGTKSGDITKSGELWRAAGMVGKSCPLLVDGRVYAFDDGAKLYVIDAADGEEVCKPVKLVGTIMRSSPVYGDGKIYACTTSAWHVIQPTKEGVKITQKLRLPEDDEISGSPIISHGKVYLPTAANLYCLGSKDQKHAAAAQPEPLEETPAGAEDKPAQLQVIPADVLLPAGGKQKFSVRLFNARGQLVDDQAATFSLKGPGDIDEDGNLTVPSGSAHTATILTAKAGDLTGQARIRVVPPLPWKFNFADGEVPVTWVGARHRHIVRDVKGEKVMVKVTTIPKGTRSQLWMGPTDLHDYTTQADVQGTTAHKKLPDMGVIAQRYTLDLMGASQQLQIRSWTPQLSRFSKSVSYAWEPGVWYTLKLQASTSTDGKAMLKGKVWPRDKPEPKAWTIEATDEYGNQNGSPGLFGNASDAEIFIDNVSVTSNQTTRGTAARQ